MFNVLFLVVGMVIILGLAAVGGMLTERSGIINLSIEGFMTIGAIAYAVIIGSKSYIGSQLNQFWAMPVAAIISGLFAIIYSFITVKLKANQTIAGIALNIFALALSIYIVHSNLNPQQDSGSDKIKIQEEVWGFGNNKKSFISIFNIIMILGLPAIAIVIFVLNKTKYGIKLKACGEQPQAAASLGINVEKTQFLTIIFSGAVSGLAGAMFAQLKFSYFFGTVQGVGFLAVALVIFGQWRPSYILMGALLFGSLYAIIEAKQFIDWLKKIENPVLLETVPYVISLIVLVFTQRSSKVPKAIGIPYHKNL